MHIEKSRKKVEMINLTIKGAMTRVMLTLEGHSLDCSQRWRLDLRAFQTIEKYISELEQREKQLEDGWRRAEEQNEKHVAELLEYNDRLIRQLEEKESENEQLKKQTSPIYDPKKQYTQDELRGYMQAACDLMNQFDGAGCYISKENNNLMIVDKCHHRVTHQLRYHELLKPPAKNRVVISRSGRLWISAGELSGKGNLRIIDKNKQAGMDYVSDWCDYLDRSHRSPRWKREWEPDSEK